MTPKAQKQHPESPIKDDVIELSVVRTYQPVEFNKTLHTYFTDRRGMDGIKMTYDIRKQIVVLECAGIDRVLVFPTNMAFAVEKNKEVGNIDRTVQPRS